MGAGKPRGAPRVGCGIIHCGIKDCDVVADVVPAMVDLPAQSKVEGEVRTDLEIILNEHLRALQACPVFGALICLPIVDVPEQEICVFETGSGYGASRTVRTR